MGPKPRQRTSGIDFARAIMCSNDSVCAPQMVDSVWDSQSKMGHHFLSIIFPAIYFSNLLQKPSSYGPGYLGDVLYYSWESVAARELPVITPHNLLVDVLIQTVNNRLIICSINEQPGPSP